MNQRDEIRERLALGINKSSMFMYVNNMVDRSVIDGIIDFSTEYILKNFSDKEKCLDEISYFIFNTLSNHGIDIQEDDADGVALSLIYLYEEFSENKSEIYDKLKGKPNVEVQFNDESSSEEE